MTGLFLWAIHGAAPAADSCFVAGRLDIRDDRKAIEVSRPHPLAGKSLGGGVTFKKDARMRVCDIVLDCVLERRVAKVAFEYGAPYPGSGIPVVKPGDSVHVTFSDGGSTTCRITTIFGSAG